MNLTTTEQGIGTRAGRKALMVFAWALACGTFAARVSAAAGATIPWRTHEAEAMKTDGAVLGPTYAPYRVEMESSGERCVKLGAAGQYVEFTVGSPANSLVVRYSLPDAPQGGGTRSSLGLFVNGKPLRTLALTSHYAWLYGNYPFSNDPAEGKPRNFYDELHVKGLPLAKGDVVRLQWDGRGADYCIIDLVDLEQVAPPREAPAGSLSVLKFGAGGKGVTDDTQALRACIAAAAAKHEAVWVPAGDYRITGDIVVPSNVTIQGAGMWYTNFVGDPRLYGHADRRVRFKLEGRHITLADFAILGRLNYRNDSEPNDGILGAGVSDSLIRNIWIEHTKTGIWIYNGARLRIEGCRFRDLLADGVNLCVGTYGTVVENCSARGTGDDCFAMWPAPSDQGFDGKGREPGDNVFRHCTGQLPFLANGGAVYGGKNNRIEDCAFTDITAGCGILLSTTFPTSDASRGIDNNFSGTTVVRGCDLLRCGGFDHDWAWRAALQICMDRRSISGVEIKECRIRDSLSDGASIVAPGAAKGEGTLSRAKFEHVVITCSGLGVPNSHDLWIRKDAVGALSLIQSPIATVQNDSSHFTLVRK